MQLTLDNTALVILYYNKIKTTEKCLNSILKGGYNPSFVFCYNNGSKPKHAETIQKLFPQINHFGAKQNYGFSGGFNRSLNEVFKRGYNSTFFLTNDTTINSRTVIEAIKKANQTKSAIIAPSILYQFKPENIHSIGAYFDFEHFTLHHYQERGLPDILNSKKDYIPGTALLINNDAFEVLSGTDENYFMYWEDVDMCFRAHQKGIKMARAYKSIVYHGVGITCHKKPIYTSYYFNRNRILFCQRFLKGNQLNQAMNKIREDIRTKLNNYHQNHNNSDQKKIFHLKKVLKEQFLLNTPI